MDVRFSNRYETCMSKISIFRLNIRKNIPFISLYSISASENLDASHAIPFIPWYIPFIKTHSYWVRWEPHQLSTLHRGHSERLFQELAPTFALVQRRIGKDSQGVPAVRQGSFRVGSGGWWVELATPGSSPKIGGYSNRKPD